MAIFSVAVPAVLSIEGGYQNTAGDSGNLNSLGQSVGTNCGISAPIYEKYIGRPPSVSDMKSITPAIATGIYQKLFWNAYNIGSISDQFIANHVFDMFVNMDPKDASEVVQLAINQVSPNLVAVDGIMGPATMNSLNYVIKKFGADAVNAAIYSQQVIKYTFFGGQFLQSWLDRSKVFENWVSLNPVVSGSAVLALVIVGFGIYLLS
ncbi:glycosyl hydrolase 108 family protein [uncultured Mucilaginibacter sp.]|uniref:glycosyl hydrolase 108 family protein n=1 Tax=uncultured Mucilaginibacter sp. TaxID=797541 RepID=UPI0025F061A9|nr:glycosyl hydrolase 108 family protein [uncultured Mucilaginibacter sp.]